MKRTLLLLLICSALLSGCSASFQTATISNDLYQAHSRTEIAERQKAEADAARAAAEARQAQWEAKLAEAKAAAAEAEYNGQVLGATSTIQGDTFSSVLADNYDSAYARRLYGFSSPTYRMPSSYYMLRYSDAYFYASAYDPAFYNVMVSGDQVWVEPKYITSMFGTWGATVVPTYSWYYGWNYPAYSSWWYGYPRYSWYDWEWGFDYGWIGPRPPYYRPPYYQPRPPRPSHSVGGGRPSRPSIVHRPNTSRPGGSPSYSAGAPQRPSAPSSSQGRGDVRRSSGTVTGSGQYRGSGSSTSRSGSYRSGTSGSSSTRSSGSSYRSGSSNSNSFRGSGGYSGGYSGGGNYSGGSHGGGQRR